MAPISGCFGMKRKHICLLVSTLLWNTPPASSLANFDSGLSLVSLITRCRHRGKHVLQVASKGVPAGKRASTLPKFRSAISYTMEELGEILGGKGRAQACFDCFRMGVDPLWYFGGKENNDREMCGILEEQGWTRQQIHDQMSGRISNGLGYKTLQLLSNRFGAIEKNVSTLSKITTCTDGTTKLLLELNDGLEIETVIIPWEDRGKSTLCISSQVGCRQACTFCATGRMGKLRSLSAEEILSQLYWAFKICRIRNINPVENIVFMGLGEPADNAGPVIRAAMSLVDPHRFALAPRRVTISTVAPTPDAFAELGKAGTVLAWSVHAAKDDLRKQLVPTTQHSMSELRDGLIMTLQRRTKGLRNIMLEVTLLDQINDSEEDAREFVGFCRPLFEHVPNIKVVVNLIPWNDIDVTVGPAAHYRKPSPGKVLAYQEVLKSHGIACYLRKTRGDEANAACGMLFTKSINKNIP